MTQNHAANFGRGPRTWILIARPVLYWGDPFACALYRFHRLLASVAPILLFLTG